MNLPMSLVILNWCLFILMVCLTIVKWYTLLKLRQIFHEFEDERQMIRGWYALGKATHAEAKKAIETIPTKVVEKMKEHKMDSGTMKRSDGV